MKVGGAVMVTVDVTAGLVMMDVASGPSTRVIGWMEVLGVGGVDGDWDSTGTRRSDVQLPDAVEDDDEDASDRSSKDMNGIACTPRVVSPKIDRHSCMVGKGEGGGKESGEHQPG